LCAPRYFRTMRKVLALSLFAALFLSPVMTKYKNCDALRKRYPYGVAASAASVGTTRATVNAKVYNANRGLDRDKDGVACET
jgi:hypothetical protein